MIIAAIATEANPLDILILYTTKLFVVAKLACV
jgi:hypothetical protein